MRSGYWLAAIGSLALAAVGPASAQAPRAVEVRFPAGATGVTLRGSVTGRDSIAYGLSASSGQFLTVRLDSKSGAANFNIYVPGKGPGDDALFTSDLGGRAYRGQLAADGKHTITVFLNRAAARRGDRARYSIRFEVAATGAAATPAPGTPAATPGGGAGAETARLRAMRGEFDANGQVPCAQFAGQPSRPCDFGVARAGGGTATVVVTRPDGTKRAISFVGGVARSADGGGAVSATKEADLNFLRIGAERYEIPDAVVSGG